MLQKYYVNSWLHIEPEDGDSQAVYQASQVEARIDELERALKLCVMVLALEQQQRDKFINASNDAIVEAEKALALMGG